MIQQSENLSFPANGRPRTNDNPDWQEVHKTIWCRQPRAITVRFRDVSLESLEAALLLEISTQNLLKIFYLRSAWNDFSLCAVTCARVTHVCIVSLEYGLWVECGMIPHFRHTIASQVYVNLLPFRYYGWSGICWPSPIMFEDI